MAARIRGPRGPVKDDSNTDAHEERDLWSKVTAEMKSLAAQASKVEATATKIHQEESKLFADDDDGIALRATKRH